MDGGDRAEITELTHEPWPGFRRAFFVLFAAACLYLAGVLFASLPAVIEPAPRTVPAEGPR